MEDITSADAADKSSEGATGAELFLSRLMNFQKALPSVFNPDRLAAWRAVDSAMKELIASVLKMAETESINEPLKCLLPEPIGSAASKDADLIGPIPALICGEPSEKSAEKSSEVNEAKTTPVKSSFIKDGLHRTAVAELLCIYGWCICEQLALAPAESAVTYHQKLVACLRIVISRVQRLLSSGSEQPDEADCERPMKNFFDTEDNKATAAALGLTVSQVERVKPAFEIFWLAHLFVLHPQLPLLEALTRLGYQVRS